MSEKVESTWPLHQMIRMARHQPERVQKILDRIFELDPEIHAELSIGAVDQEMISIPQAAQATGLEHYEVERRLFDFRQKVAYQEIEIECERRSGVAKIAGHSVAVWEIVREYRKIGSVDGLKHSFPDLSRKELAVALRYAEANQQEIQSQIDQYEAVVNRRRSEYPFSE